MKKRFINRPFLFLIFTFFLITACQNQASKENNVAHKHDQSQQYTCPMHPEIIRDEPGKCPICGMDLVPRQTSAKEGMVDTGLAQLSRPVNEQVIASTPTIIPESGTRIFSMTVHGTINYDTRSQSGIASRVSGRIERIYVKYNYQQVRKGQLIMEIYSPDLAAAQRELVYLSKSEGNSSLLQKARQRLALLGMQPAQIQQVLRTGNILYRVPIYSSVSGYVIDRSAISSLPSGSTAAPVGSGTSGGGMDNMGSGGAAVGATGTSTSQAGSAQMPAENSPILVREGQYVSAGQTLFSVYNNQRLVAEFSFDPSLAAEIKKGERLIFRKSTDPQTIYTGSIGLIQPTFRQGGNFTIARVYLTDSRFQVGQLVTGNIPIVSRGWWVPKSAVVALGSRSVVFKREGDVFVPRDVPTGITVEGLVQITEGIGGWEIAENAAYLVDSESFIGLSSANQNEQ